MRKTAKTIKQLKGKEKITALTAYDYSTALIVDQSNVDLILVGDSLAMTMMGLDSTLSVSMEVMLHHTKCVSNAVTNALVVADMPFMSFHISPEQAIENAGRFLQEANADAVKIEGGQVRVETILKLTQNDIPVLGHIGLTPQSVKAIGFQVQGKKCDEAEKLIKDALAIEKAGAFALVLECIPAELAKEITQKVSIPTIGIGAGAHCDGQILVYHDMLGLYPKLTPKFIKQYDNIGEKMKTAFTKYSSEVKEGTFPEEKHSF
ncbi:MAG: 3-methyl-2-oxobutanoate hydroxymethyltransferase [Kiritimatiellae bacterium]|jgi:3-methyl-2-oxobutanoate hydroxymethyltransferase|nr:3-methyl-2-oxobutanoate hydroxymethyltransferase [Kiritimatiellia bacterium]